MSVLLAVIALVISSKSNKYAKSANDIAEASNAIAVEAAASARLSAEAAVTAERRQARTEARGLERHEANLAVGWTPRPDVSGIPANLVGATLQFTNSGPDDAFDVRVTAYLNGGDHDWTRALGDLPARGPSVRVAPITDDETAWGPHRLVEGKRVHQDTLFRAYSWAKHDVVFRFTWKSHEGNLHSCELAIPALNPELATWST